MAGKGMESDMLALCAKHLDYDGKFTKHLETSPDFTHTLTDCEKDSLKRFESAIAILALLRARSYMKIRNEDSKPPDKRKTRFTIDMILSANRFEQKLKPVDIEKRQEVRKESAQQLKVDLDRFNTKFAKKYPGVRLASIPVELSNSELDLAQNGNDFSLTELYDFLNTQFALPCR